jgi:hypothetical protein
MQTGQELARACVPLILDGRNLLDPALMRQSGFEYHGIGVPLGELPTAARGLAAI